MITGLIDERVWTRDSAIEEVSSKWGLGQTVSGPVLTIPYYFYYKDENDKIVRSTEYAHFLPNGLNINGEVFPQQRHRGIYDIVVYNTRLHIEGYFPLPDFSEWDVAEHDILWDDAELEMGIPDMRGIQKGIDLEWDGQQYAFNPGINNNEVLASGVSVRVPVYSVDSSKSNISFSCDIDLNGSGELYFTPLGKETNIELVSKWTEPGFDGAFLPDTHRVDQNGFYARWNVLHLNRNYPQKWRGGDQHIDDSAFGVRLLLPVDQYLKSTRSAKYAILIISLTFLIFFFIEVLNAKRIHPIQYILVGLALCIFYALLLALSEHITFNTSYLIAGVAVIGLITLYTRAIFKSTRISLFLCGILILLYGFVFTVLQLQDYALLMGSIGLFIILAVVMWLSRKIDWYSLSIHKKE